jgi:hypothetical protein
MHVVRSCVCVVSALLSAFASAQGTGKELKENAAQAIKSAGTDVAKLLQLAQGWTDQKRADFARLAWKRVIELDTNNAIARAGLNHPFYDGKWFEGQTALFDYKRAEDERMAKKGLARLGDSWVAIADAPFLRLGWSKDERGAWLHPLAKNRGPIDQEMVQKGCQQQDLEWIEPADFEKWKQGLWKCGDRWLDTAAADAWHADPERGWLVAGEHFVIYTTVERERVEWCKWYADQTWADLVRIFGTAPGARPSSTWLRGPNGDKPEVVVWNGLAQYNKLGNTGESEGLSSLHYAFFADSVFDDSVKPAAFAGVGVAFWDNSTQALAGFGQHSIRHAAAQSFVEAIDPSWKALGDMAMGTKQQSNQAFWAEKKVPRWLRYGAASYVERYFIDAQVGDGGNPRWARDWALQELRKAGGVRDLAKLFEFKPTSADVPSSSQLIHEAGFVVAFMLDGGDARVQKAHQAFQQALKGGGSTAAAGAELQNALMAAKAGLAAFAGK